MRNFDRFVGIDWTGAKLPIRSPSIAVAMCDQGTEMPPTLIFGPWSRQMVADYIARLVKDKKRTLVGIDCNFGYAMAVIEAQLGYGKTAFDLWQTVDQCCANDANFFAGEFWTHPDYAAFFWTSGKQPLDFRMPRRVTETACGECGFGWPESPFKMIGAKQVGKGGLAGMRLAHHLKKTYGDQVAIWPFDTDAVCNTAVIVITEIYPRQFIKRSGFGSQKIRTFDDLNAALVKMHSKVFHDDFHSDHDTDAIIAAAGLRYLCGNQPHLAHGLSHPHTNRIMLETEGWIFGAGYT